MLVYSLPALAKGTYDFEHGVRDSTLPWLGTRDFNNYNDLKVVTDEALNGNYSLQVPLCDTGFLSPYGYWYLYCKGAFMGGPPQNAYDSCFLWDLGVGDTMWYYFYCPSGAEVDSFVIFLQDSNWTYGPYKNYIYADLDMDAWNEFKYPLTTDIEGNPLDFRIAQANLWIMTFSTPPSCTLYFDCPSTDSSQMAGITIPEQGDGAVSIARGSINCVEYSIKVSAPVMLQVFDLVGRKQKEIAPGIQAPGSYKVDLDLPTGFYFARVVAGKEVVISKITCVK
jgi:hypothetical protein